MWAIIDCIVCCKAVFRLEYLLLIKLQSNDVISYEKQRGEMLFFRSIVNVKFQEAPIHLQKIYSFKT